MLQTETVYEFLDFKNIDENHRYKSWEYCYSTFGTNENADFKALHLALYLASWGMYRGSGGLLQHSYKIQLQVIGILNKYSSLRCTEGNDLLDKNIRDFKTGILRLKDEISAYYSKIYFVKFEADKIHKKISQKEYSISSTDTLISKILLGTLSCIPAYDTYFKKGLPEYELKVNSFTQKSIDELCSFALVNRKEIQLFQKQIKKQTGFYYPFMKVVDMCLWHSGFKKDLFEKDKKGQAKEKKL